MASFRNTKATFRVPKPDSSLTMRGLSLDEQMLSDGFSDYSVRPPFATAPKTRRMGSPSTASETTASSMTGSFKSLENVGGPELIKSVLSRFYTLDTGAAQAAGIKEWLAVERDLGPVRLSLEEGDAEDGQPEMSLCVERDFNFDGDAEEVKKHFDPLHLDHSHSSPARSPFPGPAAASANTPSSPMRSPIAALRAATSRAGEHGGGFPLAAALSSPLAALKMLTSPLGSPGLASPSEHDGGESRREETLVLPASLGETGIYHVEAVEEEDIVSVRHVRRRRSLRFKFGGGLEKHTFLSLFVPHIQRPHAHARGYSHWPPKKEAVLLKRLGLEAHPRHPPHALRRGPRTDAVVPEEEEEEEEEEEAGEEFGTLARLDSGEEDNMEANFKRALEPRHFLTPVAISAEFGQAAGGRRGHEEYAGRRGSGGEAGALRAAGRSRRARDGHVTTRSGEGGLPCVVSEAEVEEGAVPLNLRPLEGFRARRQQAVRGVKERGVRYHAYKVEAGGRGLEPAVESLPKVVVHHRREMAVRTHNTEGTLPYEAPEPPAAKNAMEEEEEEEEEAMFMPRPKAVEEDEEMADAEEDKAKNERATQRAFAAEWRGLQRWWIAQYCTADYLLSADTLVAPRHEARSLCLFSLENRWRRGAIRLTESRLWTGSVFVIIIANVFLLGTTNPLDTPELVAESPQRSRVELASTFFNVFFILEACLLIFAQGFVLGRRAYLRRAANVLDFAIVLTSFLDFVSDTGGNLTALRSFRALKPLRAISRAATLRGLVQMLLRTVAYVAGALAIALGLLFVGAMLGVELFNGSLRARCFSTADGSAIGEQVCLVSSGEIGALSFPMGLPFLCPDGFSCERVAPNPGEGLTHFDDIGSAMYTLLQVLTLSEWSKVMEQLQDSYSPAVSMYFLFLVIIGPIQAVSFFLSIISSRLAKFKQKQRHHRIRLLSQRWARLNNILMLELWRDRAEVHKVLARRRQVRLFFLAMRHKALGKHFFLWDLEVRFRRLMRSERGQEYRSHVLDKLTQRRLIDPMEVWKYLVLQMHREVAKQLAIAVEKGAKRGTIQVDALGRPVVEVDRMQRLKRKIRREADKAEQEKKAKAIYLEDLETFKQDGLQSHVRARALDLLGAIERVARSPRLDAASLILILLTTLAMMMEHEYDSAVGLYWATETGWARFHAGLAYAAITSTGLFTVEIMLKVVGLRKEFFIAPDHITLIPQLQWFNIIDVGVVAISLADVPPRLTEGNCLMNAQSADDCRGGGLTFAFLRMLRFLRITRLARFLRRLPILRKQLINLVHVARNVRGLLGLLVIFLSIFAILGMTLFGGRLHTPPQTELLGVGVEGYCDVPWDPIPASSPVLGRPCRIIAVDLENHPARPYKINIVTGFSRINSVLSTHWAADARTTGPHTVTIVGVVPRENFDTFFSALVTVFILWTQPNWSGVINPLYREISPLVSLYFYLMIFLGGFLLQNLLFAAIIVEFRDRNNVAFIHEQRKRWQEQEARRERLGQAVGKKDSQSAEIAKREKIENEENEMAFIVANTTEEERAKENLLQRVVGECTAAVRLTWRKVVNESDETTCICLGGSNPVRRLANFIAFHPHFEKLMALMILMSIVMLAVDVPSYTGGRITVDFMIAVLNFVFIFECILKVTARGWAQYFTSPSDFLDLVIVMAIIAEEASNVAFLQGIWRQIRPEKERVDYDEGFSESVREKILSSLRILRVVRLFKYLRRLTHSLGLRALVVALDALHHAVRPLLIACLVAFTLFSLFAILGMQAFAGNFHYCSDLRFHTREDCIPPSEEQRKWLNAEFNFDWFGGALLSCFVIASRDGWEEIMWRGVDITNDPFTGPRWYNNLPALLFFLPLQIMSLLFIVKSFLAVFVDTYQSVSAATPYKPPPKPTRSRLPMWAIEDSPVGETRAKLQKLVNSTTMDLIVSGFVVLNIGFMAISSYQPSRTQLGVGAVTDMFFGALFGVEATVKMTIASPRLYFRNPWNRFDFALVIAHFVGVALSAGEDLDTINPTFLRSFRVVKLIRLLRILRAIRIFRLLASLHTVVEVLKETLSTVTALLLLVMLLTFLTAVVGKKLFSDMCQDGDDRLPGAFAVRCLLLDPADLLPRHVGFRHILDGMTTLAVIATLDGWTEKMQRFKLDAERRPDNHLETAKEALTTFLADPDSPLGRAALEAARRQFPGCMTSWEVAELEEAGLAACGEPGLQVECTGTCAQLASANALFTVFVVLANYILLQLVVAAMIEALKDPVQKAIESRRLVTAKLSLKTFKLVWRRWQRRARLIAPYEERWARDRMLHQQQRLAAHHHRADIARRLRRADAGALPHDDLAASDPATPDRRLLRSSRSKRRQGTLSPPMFFDDSEVALGHGGTRPPFMDIAPSNSLGIPVSRQPPSDTDDADSVDGVRLKLQVLAGPARLRAAADLDAERSDAAHLPPEDRGTEATTARTAVSAASEASGAESPWSPLRVDAHGSPPRDPAARARMRRIEQRLNYLSTLPEAAPDPCDRRELRYQGLQPDDIESEAPATARRDSPGAAHSITGGKEAEAAPGKHLWDSGGDEIQAEPPAPAAKYKIKHRFVAKRGRGRRGAPSAVTRDAGDATAPPPAAPSRAEASHQPSPRSNRQRSRPQGREPTDSDDEAAPSSTDAIAASADGSQQQSVGEPERDSGSRRRSRRQRRGAGWEGGRWSDSVQADLVLAQNLNLPFFS